MKRLVKIGEIWQKASGLKIIYYRTFMFLLYDNNANYSSLGISYSYCFGWTRPKNRVSHLFLGILFSWGIFSNTDNIIHRKKKDGGCTFYHNTFEPNWATGHIERYGLMAVVPILIALLLSSLNNSLCIFICSFRVFVRSPSFSYSGLSVYFWFAAPVNILDNIFLMQCK